MGENSHRLHNTEEQRVAGWLGDGPPMPDTEQNAMLASLDELLADGPSEVGLESMRAALDEWWAAQNLTVYYDWLSTLIGRVYTAATDQGVLSIDFGHEDEAAFLQHLTEQHLPQEDATLVRSPEQLKDVIRQVRQYFDGKRHRLDFSVDLSHLTDFQRQVLHATSQVAPGQVVTYKEIARRIGKPKAARAVGNALGRNPVPILIPCHRVLPQDGSLGGYSGGGGPRTKARLLALEGVLPGQKGQYAVSG